MKANDEERDILNFSVLRRHVPNLLALLKVSSYSVLYELQNRTKEWKKCGFEGTFFLYIEKDGCVSYTILNRLSTYFKSFPITQISLQDDSTATVPSKRRTTFLISGDIILHHQKNGSIYGIWLYQDVDRDDMFSVLRKIETATKFAQIKSLGMFITEDVLKRQQDTCDGNTQGYDNSHFGRKITFEELISMH